MTLELAGSNVTNGAGPCGGFHVVSSLILVNMHLASCVAKEKGLFGVCLDPCLKRLCPCPESYTWF